MNRIARAQNAIHRSRVLEELSEYSPAVVSTILVGLDTSESDIDIICTYKECNQFLAKIHTLYSGQESYVLSAYDGYAIGRFTYNDFLFEIYASKTPVRLQAAYRHYQVMRCLVRIGGERFSTKIRRLKQNGLKTEPAICYVMGLSGEPYAAALDLENWTDKELQEKLCENM